MPAIKGVSVAPGLAIGPVHVVRARPDVIPEWSIRPPEVAREIARLHAALAAAAEHLERQRQVVLEAAGERDAGIFAVHRMILQDPSALQTVEATIRDERINAEAAVQALIRQLFQTMGRLEGDSVRRYAEDVSEPWRVVLDLLMRREREQMAATAEPVILAAAELTPQVVTFLAQERILAVIAETGGRFSHGAVLARSFGIPCVVGLPNLLTRLEQGMRVIVDGGTGSVQLEPDQEAIDAFLVRRRRQAQRKGVLAQAAALPATTRDGHGIDVGVNVGSLRELGTFDVAHCDGVGLLRTEFLYMERSQFPSEEEQYRLYRRVVETFGDRPVVLRTLDIGGDKQLPYFHTPKEENPALGWRGLRITLEWQDLLRVQLRAAMRAGHHGDLRIMLPMVTSLEEVLAVREILATVRFQLEEQGYEVGEGLPLGIMIEVPSSIWVLEEIVEQVDFVSVGTNDLIQYLLAVDRDNPFVARVYDPHHPAVMRALAHIARIARAAGKRCGVCGEIAGDFATALLLVGLGYDNLSMAPHFLAEVRHAVRSFSLAETRELAGEALGARTAEEVRRALDRARDRLHARLVDAGSGNRREKAAPEPPPEPLG